MPKGHNTKAGRRRRKPGQPETVDRLIEAAAVAFGRAGFRGARLEDIAASAGITRPSLLHHFRSKRLLFEATLKRAFDLLEAELAPQLAQTGSYDSLAAGVVDALVEFNRVHEDMIAVVFRSALAEDETVRSVVKVRFVPLLEALVQHLLQAENPRLQESSIRPAIMSVIATQLTYSGLGEIAPELWRGDSQIRAIAFRALALPKVG